MLRNNKTILDTNVAETVEIAMLREGKRHEQTSSNNTHLGVHAEIIKKGSEITVQRNYYDMMPGGSIKMGNYDTKELIAS